MTSTVTLGADTGPEQTKELMNFSCEKPPASGYIPNGEQAEYLVGDGYGDDLDDDRLWDDAEPIDQNGTNPNVTDWGAVSLAIGNMDPKFERALDQKYTLHTNSKGESTEKQYGFLASVIDKITDGNHKAVLSVMCRRDVDHTNRCGFDLAKSLLDALVEKNDGYNPGAVEGVRQLSIFLEELGFTPETA